MVTTKMSAVRARARGETWREEGHWRETGNGDRVRRQGSREGGREREGMKDKEERRRERQQEDEVEKGK